MLLILVFAGLVFPFISLADVPPACEELEAALGLTGACNGSDNKEYDTSASYFSGGPLYSFRLNSNSMNYAIYPELNVFSVSKHNSYQIAMFNHWCNYEGVLTSDWDYGCGCESVSGRLDSSLNYDNISDLHGAVSMQEMEELDNFFNLVSDYDVSVNGYGSNCLINNALMWFRFDYAEQNSSDPVPPRLAVRNESPGTIYDKYLLYSCSGEVLVYKVWSECHNEYNNEIFFEDQENPMVISESNSFTADCMHSESCRIFAHTNDPFKSVISFSATDREFVFSQTGFEHPVLEQIGSDIKISATSDSWWTASPAYRARKIEDGRYEVIILRTPFIDECVPAGEYIYFFTDHNCSDDAYECQNFATISIGETELNRDCKLPEKYAVVLEHELKPVLIDKPFLSFEDPPSYNTFFNSCSILPGEILRRQNENSVDKKVPQKIIYDLKENFLKIENCGEEVLKVEKVRMECTDDRKSDLFYSKTTAPWKIEKLEDIKLNLLENSDSSCYYDCEVSIFSNDVHKNLISSPFLYGTDPIRNGVSSSISTDGEESKVFKGKEAVMEITVENKDCLDFTNPEIYITPYVVHPWYGYGVIDVKMIKDSIEVIDAPDFKINSDTGGTRIYLSGTLPKLEKLKIRFSVIMTTEENLNDNDVNSNFELEYSFKHKNLKNEIVFTEIFNFFCSEAEDSENTDETEVLDIDCDENTDDDKIVKDESSSSGCSMIF
jgi:hypothetical protein